MDEASGKSRKRELAKLRILRYRKLKRDEKNQEKNPSNTDILSNASGFHIDFAISDEEIVSMEFSSEINMQIEEIDDLNVSDEFLKFQESFKSSFEESTASADVRVEAENKFSENEPTMSEEETFSNNSETDDSEEDDDFDEVQAEWDEIEELLQWSIKSKIPHVHLDSLLKILRKRLLPKLPACAKTFLKTSSVSYNIETFDDVNTREYVYFGMKQLLQKTINPQHHEDRQISLLIHIDGSLPYKSSAKQFWPILGKVFHQPDVYKVFPMALYSGIGKSHNIQQFFERFVVEINDILTYGIKIENEIFDVNLKAFVYDRPARSLVKCIKNHTAKRACERCVVDGQRIERRTVYICRDDSERTDESFRRQDDVLHHDGRSPLERIDPPIDFIQQFILEPMHLLWLGVMKKFLVDIWVNGDTVHKFSQNQKEIFKINLLLLSNQIPIEFQRSTASLAELSKWKATQFGFFALYAGPLLLKEILPEQLYRHFLLFHAACRILNSNRLALKFHKKAKLFLQAFVELSAKIYGQRLQVLNLHSLLHIADDVINMGCSLNDVTAFPFESALGDLKNKLRTGYRPLEQICRRLSKQQLADTVRPPLPKKTEILRKLKPEVSGKTVVKRIMHKKAILTTKSPNNAVLLNSGKIVEVNEMYILPNSHQIEMRGNSLKILKPMYEYSCDSSQINM